MKLTIFLAIVLCAFVVYTQAQRCNVPPRQQCTGGRNVGRGGPGCFPRTMWWYGRGQCREMRYRGCGGNANRYCSRADCERNCRRGG